MNEVAGKQPEAPSHYKVSSETLSAKKQTPNTRFGLGAVIGLERRAHQARRERAQNVKAEKILTNVRAEIAGISSSDKPGMVSPARTDELKTQQSVLQEQQGVPEGRQTYSLITGEKNAYSLNLPTNATLDDVRTALQGQGATDLVRYLERHIYAPDTVNMEYIQEAAQTFNSKRRREVQKPQSRKGAMKTLNYRRERDGKKFTLTIPKDATAYEFVQALQVATGDEAIGKDGFYTFPGELSVTETLKGLLQADFSDLPDFVKDIWKAIKKSMRQYDQPQNVEA